MLKVQNQNQNIQKKIEISFKDDKVNKVKMTYTFDNKDDTKKFVDSYNAILSSKCFFASEDEKVSLPTMEQKGKKAIMEMDAKMYSEMSGETEAGMTKDEVKSKPRKRRIQSKIKYL